MRGIRGFFGGRRKALLALPVIAGLPLVLAACGAQTSGASNVRSTSATLNATFQCDSGQGPGQYWVEYKPDGGNWSSRVVSHSYLKSQCPGSTAIHDVATGLSPSTSYSYRACGTIQGQASQCFDGTGSGGGTNYDRFHTNPRLGYNIAGGHLAEAKDGHATWIRVQPEGAQDVQDAHMAPLIVMPRPHCVDPDATTCQVADSVSEYQQTCSDTAGDAPSNLFLRFEVMNETNHPVGNGWTAPLRATDFAEYFYACYQGIREVNQQAPILGGSVVRVNSANPDIGGWQSYEQNFDSSALVSGLDYRISSHIYPKGQDLSSPIAAKDYVSEMVNADRQNMPGHDLVITEMGIKDGDLGSDPCGISGTKATYLQGMFVRAGELGVSSAFIFGLVRTGGFGDYGVFPECGYELLRDAAD